MKDSYALNINNQNCVNLPGKERDNTLSFNKDISTLWKKARNQSNAAGRTRKYLGLKGKKCS